MSNTPVHSSPDLNCRFAHGVVINPRDRPPNYFSSQSFRRKEDDFPSWWRRRQEIRDARYKTQTKTPRFFLPTLSPPFSRELCAKNIDTPAEFHRWKPRFRLDGNPSVRVFPTPCLDFFFRFFFLFNNIQELFHTIRR